mgnify:CR=1 FL=1
MTKAPRSVLYGVGRYGQEFTRLAVRRGWPIVAAVNRAGAEVGRDFGEVCGLDLPLGLRVADCDGFDYVAGRRRRRGVLRGPSGQGRPGR